MKILGRYEKMCRLCGKDFTTLIEKQTVCTKVCIKLHTIKVDPDIIKKERLDRERVTTNRYNRLKERVKEMKGRGFTYIMPRDKYFEIIKKNCYYCNRVTWGVDTGCGLDRLDNDKEYLESNVVSCCMKCNISRGNMYTSEEFKALMDSERYIRALGYMNDSGKTLEEFADAIIEQYTKKETPT